MKKKSNKKSNKKFNLNTRLDMDVLHQFTMLLQITLGIFLLSFAFASLFHKELYMICQLIIGALMFVIAYNNAKIYKRKYMTAIYLGLGIVIIASALFV